MLLYRVTAIINTHAPYINGTVTCANTLLIIHYDDVIMTVIAFQITSLTLLNHLFGRISKKTSKLRVTGLCGGNSPRTGEFPAQMASNAENVSIWWRHHALQLHYGYRVINRNSIDINEKYSLKFFMPVIPNIGRHFSQWPTRSHGNWVNSCAPGRFSEVILNLAK